MDDERAKQLIEQRLEPFAAFSQQVLVTIEKLASATKFELGQLRRQLIALEVRIETLERERRAR